MNREYPLSVTHLSAVLSGGSLPTRGALLSSSTVITADSSFGLLFTIFDRQESAS